MQGIIDVSLRKTFPVRKQQKSELPCMIQYPHNVSSFSCSGVKNDPELKGVIPHSFDHIFSHISRSENQQYLVRASYLEIYMVSSLSTHCLSTFVQVETVPYSCDSLVPFLFSWAHFEIFCVYRRRSETCYQRINQKDWNFVKDLILVFMSRWDGNSSDGLLVCLYFLQLCLPCMSAYLLQDLSSFVTKSVKEIEHVMNIGNQNRSVGWAVFLSPFGMWLFEHLFQGWANGICVSLIDSATNMNEHSSRSHAIFIITIECSEVSTLLGLSLWLFLLSFC